MAELDESRRIRDAARGTFRATVQDGVRVTEATGAVPAPPAAPAPTGLRKWTRAPAWVWRLARWSAVFGAAVGLLIGALNAGEGATATRRVALAAIGGVCGGLLGMGIPLLVYWVTMFALVATVAIGVILLLVWLVRQFAHK